MNSKYATIATILFSFLGAQSAVAEDVILPYDGAYINRPGYVQIIFRDGQTNYLESTAPNKVGDPYNAVFPACESDIAKNCIESVDYKVGDGEWEKGELSDYVQTGMDGQIDGRDQNGNIFRFNNFPEDKKSGSPGGGKASTWILNGAPHAGGREYLASVTFNSNSEFSVNLIPIKWGELSTWNWDGNSVSTRKWSDYEFPEGVQFRMNIHLGVIADKVNTWFFGRLTSPTINVTGDLLTITAFPGYSSAAASDYFNCGHSVVAEADRKRIIFPSGCTHRTISPQNDSGSYSAFKYFEPYLHQWKYQTAWKLDSQDSSKPGSVNAFQIQKECKIQGIAGVSVTNALIMQNQLPTWDANSRELIYNIASTHLDAYGKPNIGNLDIVLSEKLAKCLWGATSLNNAQAKVSVMYENGEKIISTSVSSLSNGWIYLKVSNFTFSTPKVKFSMTIPSTSQIKKKSTIKCVKGKKIILVTGVSPKCPPGYKKT